MLVWAIPQREGTRPGYTNQKEWVKVLPFPTHTQNVFWENVVAQLRAIQLTALRFAFISLLSGPSFQMGNEEKIHSLEESDSVMNFCPNLGVKRQYSILLV